MGKSGSARAKAGGAGYGEPAPPNRDRPCRKPAQEPLSGRDRVSLVCALGGILRAFAAFAPQDP